MYLIHVVFVITVAQYVGVTEGCSTTLPGLYSPVGANVLFTFQFTIPSGIVTVQVTKQAGPELVSVQYFGGNVAGEQLISPRIDVSGGFNTGDWSFTLNNIQTSDNGLYKLGNDSVTLSCVTLYVTGKPTKPVISPTPVSANVGDTATFTCTSSSTTVPTGSGLTMFYTWRRNGANVTSGGRYEVSGQTLSVTNVVKVDYSDTFTCTVREDKGLTSDESDSATIDVTYGPDAVTLQPTTTDISYEEGDSTNNITCSADCNPPCTFQWKKFSTSLTSGGVLSLRSADKSDVGTYTCTASRGTSSSRDSPSVTVTVKYGPGASIVMNPSATVQTFNENQGSIPNIQCSADCNPGCTYSWSGDRTGPVTHVNGVLSLGVVNRTKADRYTCTATGTGNPPRTATISVTVFVHYGPDAVTLQPTTTDISYEEGDSTNSITCSADCNPPCTFQWKRSSTSLSSGGVLYLGSADKSDVGTYTCTASRDASSSRDSPSVKVTVNYGPGTSIVMTPSATVQTFNEIQDSIPTIQCSAECNPVCTYSWSGDMTGPVTPVNGVLSLGVANRIKADNYMCTATRTGNTARTATISVTIFVRYGPTYIQLNPPTGEVTVIEGSTTQDISCSSDCYPGCDCTWSQFNNNGVFRLGTVYRNVSGNYTCTCINRYTQTGWTLDKRVTVIVQYFPDLHITTNKVVTEHDTNIQLSCTADGVPAQYTSGGWTHFLPDNQTAQHDLSNTAIVGKVFSLNLPTVTYMDTGRYRCMVSNGITDYRTGEVTTLAMAETTLLVNGSPVITQQEENTAGKTNSNATLSAKVFSQSKIVVQWFKEHNDSWSLVSDGRFHSDVTVADVSPLYYGVPVKQSGFMASLHIENVQSPDFARYRLVVRNTIGNTSNTTTFRSKGPPDPPKDFSVITGSETAKNVSFKWMSGFHGGEDQHFVIEYSEAGNIWTIGVTVAGGFDENKLFQGTVSELKPDTTYNFRLHAESDNGVSPGYLNTTATTKAVPAGPGPTGNLIGPIAGGLGGAVVISILVIVIVVFVRRYKGKSDTGNDRKTLDNSEEDIVINDMYGSHQMHSNVQSSASTSGNASQLYAEVVKPKKKPVNEDANLYAMVDKSKKQNPKPKGAVPETVYENPETLQGKNAGNADLVYENHKPPAPPSRGKNENSLHYADLEFVKSKNGGKKIVIHGLENSTDYAEVVIGKRGTPLPDSDDETPSANQE